MRTLESRRIQSVLLGLLLVFLAGMYVAIALWWTSRPDVLSRGGLFLLSGLLLMALLAGGLYGLWRRLVETERLANERAAALRQGEQKFRRLLEDIPNISVQGYDEQRRVIFWNAASEHLYGYRRDEALGKLLEELIIPPPMRSQVIQGIERWLQEGVPVPASELELLRKDGSLAPVYSSHVMLSNERGLQELYCLDVDLSERKRAEQELRLAAQVFENSREAIMITDAQTHILSVNRAFSDLTGYAAAEVVGHTPRLLASGRHDRDFYQQLWQALVATGHWQGEIWNRRRNGEIYPQWLSISAVCDSQRQLTHYVGIFSDLSERKASAERIEFLAHHDALTALPDRLLLHDRLARALSLAEHNRSSVALLILDLDRFKLVNDSLGHELGDQLLQMVASRLRQRLRETDTISRQGGDEFLILLPDAGQEGASRVARDLLECLNGQSWRVADHSLGVTASIGISLYPDTGQDRDTLLRQAGTALTYAKNGGGNAYRFFAAGMNVNTLERLQLETGLREALERGEFLLHYQPRIDLATGRIVGAEALLRWRHPERGLVPPGQFIPAAEDSGLIIPIGTWVLREACRQAHVWQQAGLPRITVAVNLSALQFQRSELLDTIQAALAESGLAPEHLELELTESILIQDAAGALTTVQQLRATGLKLSIDDFGTGYSSLGYLQKLAVQALKIDQSFVRGLTGDADSAAIVRAVIQLAHSLKLVTVAEGVETDAQFAFLRNHGCDQVQGYYFSRPVPAEEFARLLARGMLVGETHQK